MKEMRLFLLLLLLTTGLEGRAQSSEPDTLTAHQQLDMAYTLRDNAEYELSATVALRAARLFNKAAYPLRSAYALYIAGNSLRMDEQVDKASEITEEAMVTLRESASADHTLEIQLYINLALISHSDASYPKALDYLQKADSIREKSLISPVDQSTLSGNFGLVYDSMGEYNTALTYYKRAVMELGDPSDAPKEKLAKLYNNIGIAHSNMGDYDKALTFYEKEVTLNREVYGENHPNVAGGYINLGATAYRKSDIGLAISYFKNALHSLKASLGDHPMTAMAANNIGLCYVELQQLPEATNYLEQAIDIKIATRGPDHPDVAVSYKNLGGVYARMGKPDRAQTYYRKALEIERNRLGNDHPQLAFTHIKMGDTFINNGQPDRGIDHLQRARELIVTHRGERHPKLAEIHRKIGDAYRNKNQPTESLAAYHAGLRILTNASGDFIRRLETGQASPGNFRYASYTVPLLTQRGETLRALYKQKEERIYLIHAMHNYELLSGILDELQLHYASEQSKLLMGQKSHAVYEEAIKTAYELYRQTDDKAYLPYILNFSEKSRARVLRENLQRREGASFAGVPDSLVAKEQRLQSNIARLEQHVSMLEEQQDSVRLRQLSDSLFTYKTHLSSHIDQLRKQYPAYYRFRYANSVPSLRQIQKQLQESGTTIVEYFAGNDALYGIVVTPSDLHVKPLTKTDSLDQHLQSFRTAITRQSGDYSELGHRLYRSLIEPLEPHISTDKLLIIPEGPLARMPFEALLTTNPGESTPASYPYLMNRYRIHYAGSISLSNALNHQTKRVYKSPLLAMAPTFEPDGLRTGQTYRGSWQPLSTTGYEVRTISGLFEEQEAGFFDFIFGSSVKTTTLIGAAATEQAFKQSGLSHYRIIHLATHAFVSDSSGGTAGIVFSSPNNEDEDGILHSSEIYSLQLNNELVVLSACDTGRGSLMEGEGLMGLSRAFQYAGAENLLVSLWQVEDRSTTRLMIRFYRQLMKGASYSEALQQAKKALAQSKSYAHPRYWAPFILYGN